MKLSSSRTCYQHEDRIKFFCFCHLPVRGTLKHLVVRNLDVSTNQDTVEAKAWSRAQQARAQYHYDDSSFRILTLILSSQNL